MEDGKGGETVNPWAVALFRTLKTTDARTGLGQIEPVAMKRSQDILDRERAIAKARGPLPCDARGVPAAA